MHACWSSFLDFFKSCDKTARHARMWATCVGVESASAMAPPLSAVTCQSQPAHAPVHAKLTLNPSLITCQRTAEDELHEELAVLSRCTPGEARKRSPETLGHSETMQPALTHCDYIYVGFHLSLTQLPSGRIWLSHSSHKTHSQTLQQHEHSKEAY